MRTIILFLIMSITLAQQGIVGQVGVGTTSPLATLHIADTPDPMRFIIDGLPEETNPQSVLTRDDITGEVKWADIDNLGIVLIPNIFDTVQIPSTSLSYPIPNGVVWTLIDQDLGISQSINISAGQRALYGISYSVPLEVTGDNIQVETIAVVTCEVDGVVDDSLTSTFKLDSSSQNSLIRVNSVITLSNSIGTRYVNSGTSTVTRNYVFKLSIYQNWAGVGTSQYTASIDRTSTLFGISYN